MSAVSTRSPARNDRLAGHTFIVTGASHGIGLAVASRLVADGGRVVLTGRKQEALDAAVAELGGAEVATARVGQRRTRINSATRSSTP